MGRAGVLICREPEAAGEVLHPTPGAEVRWDNRFCMLFSKGKYAPARGLTLARLGGDGWAEIVGRQPELRKCPIPGPARASLPAFRDTNGILAVPHLGYGRHGAEPVNHGLRALRFEPPMPLAGTSFSVVSEAS
jgi:tRNA(Ile)-lysidine synthase